MKPSLANFAGYSEQNVNILQISLGETGTAQNGLYAFQIRCDLTIPAQSTAPRFFFLVRRLSNSAYECCNDDVITNKRQNLNLEQPITGCS